MVFRFGDFEYKTRWHWYWWKLKYNVDEGWFEWKDALLFGLSVGLVTGILVFLFR